MKAKYLNLIIVIIYALVAGCITVAEQDSKTAKVKNQEKEKGQSYSTANFESKYFIYRESEWPLERFFSQLIDGEFDDAFRKLNFEFQPSNHTNDMFQNLLERGYRPVFISLKNLSEKELIWKQDEIKICDNKKCFASVNKTYVPRVLVSENPGAYVANTINLTAGVLVGMTIAFALGPLMPNSEFDSMFGGGDGSVINFNSTEKRTKINYEDLILGDINLGPQKSLEGVMYFQTFGLETNELRLSFPN